MGLVFLGVISGQTWAGEMVKAHGFEGEKRVGEAVRFYVEIRSPGSFAGSSTFLLPEVPHTFIMKPSGPAVSSEEVDGKSYFVQTHEFILISQTTGTVQVPEFPVSYGTRDGFTGPVEEVEGVVPGFEVSLKRPAGTEGIGFLVTVDGLEISEHWEPTPEEVVEVGTIYKRTISQQVEGMTGMALAPVPTLKLDGVKTYPGKAAVEDRSERGVFTGKRKETLSYLLEKPGTHTLPALRYVWWSPSSGKLEEKVFPAVTIEAVGGAAEALSVEPDGRNWWIYGLVLGSGLLLFLKRDELAGVYTRVKAKVNSPQRIAMKQLREACQNNDDQRAHAAWSVWRGLVYSRGKLLDELAREVAELERHLYAAESDESWSGVGLLRALSGSGKPGENAQAKRGGELPSLNP